VLYTQISALTPGRRAASSASSSIKMVRRFAEFPSQ